MNESIYAGGYRAVSRGGQYRGAYQFDRDTWDGTARYLERFDLVGVDPAAAPPVLQDLLAYSLYKWQGASHWANRCAGLP
jgi:translation initiation factor IF-3